MESTKPGKQRRELYNAPLHKKRNFISAHLEEKLLLKYDKRATPVVKGDTVKVMRGAFRGHEDKVAKVIVKKRYLEIEGLMMAKADGNKIAKPIHSSNVMITKLNLTDKWRRRKLERGLSEETKKEIEAEAKEQIKEVEEEKKREEELKAKEEAEAKAREEAEEEIVEEEPVEEAKTEEKSKPKTEKKELEKKPKTKTEPIKEEIKKKTPTAKKETPAKKPQAKKTTTKTLEKKEEKK
jgi:large subunit ribosomal protein L24